MLARINVGGVLITFGEPQSPNKPEPFYPYLESVTPIQDTVGDTTGTASFVLKLKAQGLLGLHLARPIQLLNDNLEVQFEGVVSRIAYKSVIEVSVDA